MLVKDKIAIERRKKGISTSQLAEMIGVNIGTLNRYENGVIKTIPVETLHKIASSLECSFDELVQDDPRYIMLSDKPASLKRELSEEDIKMITWFHNLPENIQHTLEGLWR